MELVGRGREDRRVLTDHDVLGATPAVGLDVLCIFLFNRPAATDIYPLSLHDALPISRGAVVGAVTGDRDARGAVDGSGPIGGAGDPRSEQEEVDQIGRAHV